MIVSFARPPAFTLNVPRSLPPAVVPSFSVQCAPVPVVPSSVAVTVVAVVTVLPAGSIVSVAPNEPPVSLTIVSVPPVAAATYPPAVLIASRKLPAMVDAEEPLWTNGAPPSSERL